VPQKVLTMTVDKFIEAVRNADLAGEKEVTVRVDDLVNVVNYIQGRDDTIKALRRRMAVMQADFASQIGRGYASLSAFIDKEA